MPTTKKRVVKKATASRPPTKRAANPKTMDDYLAGVSGQQRRAFGALRRRVRAIAPEATESISYGIPTFKLGGKPLVYFGAWAGHYSLYGPPFDTLTASERKSYVTGKGTISLPANKPLPVSMVTRLIRGQMARLKKGATTY